MGNKITIDSATLMNKGLEVIEAHWLFGMPPEAIDVVVHRQSIVHSMVEFVDGSVMAQLGYPDMRLPIQYCLTYPQRCASPARPMDFTQALDLHFDPVDEARFPALMVAKRALVRGGTVPAAFNAANEIAVERFCAGRLRFSDIAVVVGHVVEAHPDRKAVDLATILADDAAARRAAGTIADSLTTAGCKM